MRGSYSGNTLAFQAKARSSILLPRSTVDVLARLDKFLPSLLLQVKFAHLAQWQSTPLVRERSRVRFPEWAPVLRVSIECAGWMLALVDARWFLI